MFMVTTSLRGDQNLARKALEISTALNVPFLPRNGKNINGMLSENKLDGVLLVGKKRLSYIYPGGEFFFHPGMAKLRINEILNGKTDQMIKALDLKPGDSVLDCTLGLGSDAILISYMNEAGEITGIEQSPVISLIVSEGLSTYREDISPGLERAMRRIKVVCADYNDFLKVQPDNSVDIIYFDPMFRVPKTKSCAIAAMRPLTNNSPLTRETLQEALCVARRRVVVKEARNGREFARLGITKVSGGKYSPVGYGIIEKRGG